MLGEGLAMVIAQLALAFCFIVMALPILIYGLAGKNERRTLVACWVAMSFVLIALLLTNPFWLELATGQTLSGEKLDLKGRDTAVLVITGTEALVFSAALAALVRRLLRRSRVRA